MARQNRKISRTRCYHIMLRGNNSMDIFLDNRDRLFFLTLLKINKEQSDFQIYAYCLMDNHIHLVLQESSVASSENNVSAIMKKLGVSYVKYFNKKYSRIGTLFQDRFKSESVENDSYLLAVIRYVLCNPCKAMITDTPWKYRWSSAGEYLTGCGGLTDVATVLPMFNDDIESVKMFMGDAMKLNEAESFLELDNKQDEKEANLKEQWKRLGFLSLEEKLKILYYEKGNSLRMLEKISGLSRFKIKSHLDFNRFL